MSKIRTIYLYLVCLITLFMAIGGFISGIHYIAECFFPTSYSDPFKLSPSYTSGNSYLENEKIRSAKASITSFALVAVACPIFMYHWKKVESERKESGV